MEANMSDDLRKTQPWPEVESDPYSILNWCHVHENKSPCADCEDEQEQRTEEEAQLAAPAAGEEGKHGQ